MYSKFALLLPLIAVSCSQKEELTRTPIPSPNIVYSSSQEDIAKGKELFYEKGCSACHKIGQGKLVGPDLLHVTERRSTDWIAKMILRPDIMIKENTTAQELFKLHMTPMPNQNVDPQSELPFIMSYLKSN